MPQNARMARHTALVTGANRGLGKAIAAALGARGHRVIVAARRRDDAQRAAAELGEWAVPVELDVTDPESVTAARKSTGPVEILINNAGVLLDAGASPGTVSLDLVAQHFTVNTLGNWRVTQAYLPDMLERGFGRIVMISSGTSTFTNGVFPGAPGYSASKTALNALTVMLAQATRDSGVLVNAVNPGRVRTRMFPQAEVLPEVAAEDVAWVAELPADGPSGRLFRSRQVVGW